MATLDISSVYKMKMIREESNLLLKVGEYYQRCSFGIQPNLVDSQSSVNYIFPQITSFQKNRYYARQKHLFFFSNFVLRGNNNKIQNSIETYRTMLEILESRVWFYLSNETCIELTAWMTKSLKYTNKVARCWTSS
jgi:hypothetical protein